MTKCKFQTDLFPRVKSKKIGISFDGGDVTSDAGIFLLRQADKTLKLSHKVSKIIPDPRNPFFITHSQDSMIQQLLYGLALGYEDLNDHESLREDLAFQSAVEREEVLAGKSTLCRLQQRANKHTNKALSELLVDLYIKSQPRRPKEIILDFDATDTPLHGDQQDKFFHGYYDNYCYLPLFVFAGDFPLYALLRKSDKDASQGSDEILSFLTERLRKKWPGVRIIFRGDSGFCRWKLHQWCEKNKVEYITGLARNSVLMEMCRPLCAQVEKGYAKEKVKQKKYRVLAYGAKTWDKKRRVLVKAEYNSIGPNTRFVVTNIKGTAKELYEEIYCARGDMENRIKEQQLDLFGDRMSACKFQMNWFRLLMSTLSYVLINQIRRVGLKGTELAASYCGTIRLKLLKIGAIIIRNTRSIKLIISSASPGRIWFLRVAERLRLSSA